MTLHTHPRSSLPRFGAHAGAAAAGPGSVLNLFNRVLAGVAAVLALWTLALPAQAQPQPPPQTQPGSSPWQRCAGQDEVCRFRGEALVRYGVDGSYAYRVARNRVLCDEQEFGDPIFGRVKGCDFNPNLAQPEAAAAAAATGWVYCGGEDEICRFKGAARVRYGANDRFFYRSAVNSVSCSARFFGDPAFGVKKQCHFQTQSTNAGSGSFANDDGWVRCASEGGVCQFSGTAEVRYGASGQWVVRKAINSMPCEVVAFGADPAFGVKKSCFVRTAPR